MRCVEHAAARRDVTESVLARLTYNDGHVGWGECLPREYVTGETVDSVVADTREILWPTCLEQRLLEPSEMPAPLPTQQGRRHFEAAAAALDLASLRRVFHDLHAISPELLRTLAGRPRMRNYIDSKVSGLLTKRDARRLAWRLRILRLGDVKDYKLKIGFGEEIDRANLRAVHKQLRGGLRRGEVTLRVDVNGAWTPEETPARVEELRDFDVCAVEQPAFCSARKFLALAERCSIPLLADESLVTERHARALVANPEKVWWNLRISKNGGLLATLKLMRLAEEHRVPFTLGCMVGETCILSAAQRRLLQLGPAPRFVEGNFGRFLLRDDLLVGWRSLRLGYAGTLRALRGDGLGIEVDTAKIQRYAEPLVTLPA